MRETTCPGCGYACDGTARVGGDQYTAPEDGDVSICLNCGAVSLFDGAAPGGVRSPDAAQLAEIMAERNVRQAVSYIRVRGLFR